MPAQLELRKPAVLSGYSQLLKKVRETLLEGQRKIERQKALTYWQTGRHLHEHIFPHESRAAHYGKDVIEKLAGDLSISERVLYQCLQVYRSLKNLNARSNSFSLTWAHYRAAARIPDEKKRLVLIERASEERWTSRELEIEVRNHNWADSISKDEKARSLCLPLVCLGPFYTYQIVRPEAIHSRAKVFLLDLGFSHALEMDLFPSSHFGAGTVVTSAKDSRGRYTLEKAPLQDSSPKPQDGLLYTYKAYVEKVLDGDTLKLEFELGFGNRQRETIRLNHIDCPETDSAEGRAAKRFVESQLAGCEFITVKSVRTRKEKWGRYLGDVFFQKNGGARSVYLNQLLLDKGHAVRVRM